MELSKYIDHTLLKAESTEEQVNQIIKEAKDNNFASVMINPYWVKHTHEQLKGTDIHTATVIGFPLGANTTDIKVAEAKKAMEDGADELDMVLNIGELKGNNLDAVESDIVAVVEAGHAQNKIVKVIIETALLTDDEKVTAAKLVMKAGADFVKTSTGFSTAGAKVEDVKLLKQTVGDAIGVKASGGIHSKAEAMSMIAAGATRLGTSASIKIVEG
ncbi:deoxyribose-phosphate aldolase [Companilactobacillus mindensis DSM 14500]|jgi:deoxyribose-phosphate aldolase|uniref:Deoxyribose-phosphate aldolase n=1 Tax=Companilactobacillus mindensis DSM 14500 TaxID=1423770 RepID=A0A0R1QSQ0_9LACO|nr:deoxyribose-phosphate aldolase [Companilactobacillus mindensis]KRL44024.1 deoxyribose-phosphate aldolase [Companilactobacillus mindensis DSM 14500]GEO78933.1 deoxyribose-phosphate aldolase [Companilactobacillus mindensis]